MVDWIRDRIALQLATRAHAPQPVRSALLRLLATAMLCLACLAGGAAIATWHAQRRAAAALPPARPPAEAKLQAELTRAQLALAQSEAARQALQAAADTAVVETARLDTEVRFLRSQRAAKR